MIVSYWSFTDFGTRQADTYESAFFWLKTSAFWFLVIPAIVHFLLAFTGRLGLKPYRFFLNLVYIIAITISVLALFTEWVFGNPILEYYGWTYGVNDNLGLYFIIYAFTYVILGIDLIIGIKYYRETRSLQKRNQAKLVVIGFFVFFINTNITEGILPIFGIRLPELVAIHFSIGCIFFSIALIRHGLFVLNPITAAEHIMVAMVDALILVNQDGFIVGVNPATIRMLGLEEVEMIGMPINNIWNLDYNADSISWLQPGNEIDHVLTNSTAIFFKTKSGSLIPVSITASKVVVDENHILGIAIIARNLTEKNQYDLKLLDAFEKITQNEKLANIGKLSGIIAHEIRNPLGVISNSIYFLSLKLETADEKVKRHVVIIQNEVNHAAKIISELLDSARLKDPVTESTDINQLIREELEGIVFPANVSVITRFSYDIPRILVDRIQIKMVFFNIITNAWQAMPEGGILEIGTTISGEHLHAWFKDSGIGMSEETLRKIFVPLFSTKTKGVGLGLALSRDIISKHKGTIEVDSEPGRGTTFTVILRVYGNVESEIIKSTS
jgi:PAS domain S-box-containing protein